jgi:hypothetical protein
MFEKVIIRNTRLEKNSFEIYVVLSLASSDNLSYSQNFCNFFPRNTIQILSICYIYMDLMHPFYLNTQRKKLVDGDMLKSLTVNINEKLDANHEKLRKEFDQMADQHHFEE